MSIDCLISPEENRNSNNYIAGLIHGILITAFLLLLFICMTSDTIKYIYQGSDITENGEFNNKEKL